MAQDPVEQSPRQSAQNSTSTPTWAGFGGIPVTEELAAALDLSQMRGVLIVAIHPRGPAARAGLQLRDVIFEVDGSPLTDAAAWSRSIPQMRPGTKLELLVQRRNEQIGVELTVEQQPVDLESRQRP